MVSDFFYPNMGGVEGHIYHLSQRLARRGHKVVVVTHRYGGRVGVRYLTSGVKVYHVPHWLVHDQVSLPTLYGFFPLFRYIVVRESIDVVHGHQAFSAMCHEAILHARTMGLRAVFTDHSLFGFEDTSSILTNKLLKFTLSDIDHVICVSHTSKENTVLRASLNPLHVSVIPNAVVCAEFTPDPSMRDPKKSKAGYFASVVAPADSFRHVRLVNSVTIVVASRLVYRKGIDLLVAVIPAICQEFPQVQFVIGGDGPKRVELEQMRERFVLQDRVQLLGAVNHSDVRDLLCQGHIFLNTSLTEAFCIAIVEAASCGLLVVSTRVGGVPEVLPDDMIMFANPEEGDIIRAMRAAIGTIKENAVDPFEIHRRVSNMYSWTDVAARAEEVYRCAMEMPAVGLAERLLRYNGCGVFAGKLAAMIMAVDFIIWMLLDE
ncbi:Phosphatidylinositol N-acetylglucosaminyltransferase GPI3 subunit [Polyrhizophydium stewartii]|uniref:Phosphatidylinositol N-acetylglucosaminyltransferase GPI3 subunit n=1 Tax=Polyrhizophydium stewartii TaxID=2732419 RepID=A0ABR4NL27_9FUNG